VFVLVSGGWGEDSHHPPTAPGSMSEWRALIEHVAVDASPHVGWG